LSPSDEHAHTFLSRRNIDPAKVHATKFHWLSFVSAILYSARVRVARSQKESQMAWKAPKIVEVPVGMEINMYACAARK